MTMRGLLSGQRRRRKPLVYVPFESYISILSASTYTADLGLTETPALDPLGTSIVYKNAPPGGTLVALEVHMWLRNSTANATVLCVHEWDTPYPLGPVTPTGGSTLLYGGAVASHYDNQRATVRTGGKGNLQFKYSVGWSAGTTTVYLRALGAWYEVP